MATETVCTPTRVHGELAPGRLSRILRRSPAPELGHCPATFAPAGGAFQMNFQHARGADRRRWCVRIPSVGPVLGGCQTWSSRGYAVGLLLLAAFGCAPMARTSESDA